MNVELTDAVEEFVVVSNKVGKDESSRAARLLDEVLKDRKSVVPGIGHTEQIAKQKGYSVIAVTL